MPRILRRLFRFTANKGYPSIPTVTEDLPSVTRAVQALKQTVEIHERRTPDILNSFVRVQELVDMGLISIADGDNFNLGAADKLQVDEDEVVDPGVGANATLAAVAAAGEPGPTDAAQMKWVRIDLGDGQEGWLAVWI